MVYVVLKYGAKRTERMFYKKADALAYYDRLCMRDIKREYAILLEEQTGMDAKKTHECLYRSYRTNGYNASSYIDHAQYRNVRDRLKAKSSKTKRSGNDYGIKGDWKPFEGM